MSEPEQIQQEESTPSAHYLDILLRRRWWLIASVVVVWAIALGLSLLLPAKYKSETLVLIEQDTVPAQYVTPNVTIDIQQRLRSLTEQILSRTQLARIAQEDHLYGTQPGQIVSDASVTSMRSDISVELIKPPGQAEVSAFKIAYSAPNPNLAQKVTGQLSSLFIQDSLRDQQQLSKDTTQFLEGQLNSARADLEQQEKLLSEFKKKYLGELPEQLVGNVQILSGLQGRLTSATAALHQAEQQKLYLSSMLGAPRSSGDTSPSNNIAIATPADEQIEKMKDDLANLSAQYTQRHPDVIHLKERIENAEKAKRQAENSPRSGAAPAQSEGGAGLRSERAISPRSQLESQFRANGLEIENLKQEIRGLEREIGQYQARLNLTPLRQQQLAEVTRNYQQSQTNYESLLAKKQQSGMATDLSKARQGEQFRMIDPPSLPQKPYWPNPLRFSGIGLFVGLFLGLAGVVLLESVDARVYSEDDLQRWVSVPVIATVPPLTTTAEKKRQAWQRGVEIGIAAVLVALVPALTFMAYLKG